MRTLPVILWLALAVAACARQPTARVPHDPSPVARPQSTESAAAPSVTAPSATPTAAAPSAAPPSALAPADGKPCGMPTSLVALGFRSELTPTSNVESPAFVAGATTLVVLPDTQYYAPCASPHFAAQTRWAAAQKQQRNAVVVVTLGDLTDHNTSEEWSYVRDGVRLVEDELPFVLVTGNHDHGELGRANVRRSLLPQAFPTAPGVAAKALVETRTPGDIENAYYRVTLPRVTLGVLALEWSPRTSTLAWANAVLARHPTDRVIVVTHAYLYDDGTRYDYRAKGPKQDWNPLSYGTGKARPPEPGTGPDAPTDGEMLWNELVKKQRGVFLVLSGHVLRNGTGVLASRGEHGNLVQQVLVNYQMLRDGGLGYLRLLELLPDGKTLRMKSFSPTLGVFATGADQNGDLAIEPPLY